MQFDAETFDLNRDLESFARAYDSQVDAARLLED